MSGTAMPRKVSLSQFILEGVVIVASILAAFGIQAWWDDRQENEEEHRLLTALLEESEAVLPQIEANMAFHAAIIVVADAILQAPLSETPDFPADSLDHLIASLSFARSVDFQTATLSTVLLGGRLSIIDSPDVRDRIAQWQGALEEIADVADHDFNRFAMFLREYIYEHANQAQLSNALRHIPGSSVRLANTPRPLPTGRRDHFELLRDDHFRNLVLQRRFAQEDLLDSTGGYPLLREALAGLIGALRDEIERRWGAS